MSRHFIWAIPLINLAIFVFVGAILWLLAERVGRRGRAIAVWLLGALIMLPPFWVAFPGVYSLAGLIMVLGVAARLVPVLRRRTVGFRRLVHGSFPVLAGVVAVLAASLWREDWIKQRRETARGLPPAGSANVLLVVMDTVAAGHLSLHGYHRRTSPAIDEMAERGVRFDRVRATSSWTLPSHASMFTGKWPHQLSAGWVTPLDAAEPTLAEFLGKRGYATAGFVANLDYCASESGLARGFTVYRDYIFPGLTAVRMAVLVDRPVNGLQTAWSFLGDLNFDRLTPTLQRIWCLFTDNRKRAEVVNREFLDWLSRRSQSERPFFAFLNYIDAHDPYRLRRSGLHRFCTELRHRRQSGVADCLELITRGTAEQQMSFSRDCYDDCIADLDEQLGRLFDELNRRAILDQTWLIITADHGESFGEHPGIIRHGVSLYQTEVHVPLVIIPPGGRASKQIVTEVVSNRDVAATVVDLLGFNQGSPFPGSSLARFWNGADHPASGEPADANWALSELIPHDPEPQRVNTRWPIAAVSAGDWTLIRREGDVREELFQASTDAAEMHNLAAEPALQTTLERMRQAMGRFTAGPLTPERFNP